jgi:hypothetical protein
MENIAEYHRGVPTAALAAIPLLLIKTEEKNEHKPW